MADRILIFDTTLRDGEQSPGCSMDFQEKIDIAACLDALGVDIIEAGFPAASMGDFKSVQAVAEQSKNAIVAGLCRATEGDIQAVADAIKPAKRGRIHTFISTSPLHRKYKLQKTEDEVLDLIRFSVGMARNLCGDVEWSAEDATRTEDDYLCRAVEVAIKAGATTINIPDTVGYTTPEDYYRIIDMLINRVPNIDRAVLSTHCHNDLGLAVANSIAGVRAGARQVECTINGIGERAGNAALEEIVMAFKTRSDVYPYTTGIQSEKLFSASQLLSSVTGVSVQPNKAIVGANAFAHESGIHQDGILKNVMTYEIMTPESVGQDSTNLVMGKHSGRNAFRARLADLGFDHITDDLLNAAFKKFKTLADKKKIITDEDLKGLL